MEALQQYSKSIHFSVTVGFWLKLLYVDDEGSDVNWNSYCRRLRGTGLSVSIFLHKKAMQDEFEE